jgi:glutathione peroxidase
MKMLYPLIMKFAPSRTKEKIMRNKEQVTPPVSFYSLQATLNNGKPFSFEALKGKKVLLVNTASNCGFTNQYAELQQLHERKKDELVIIGFPANDFKEQEKGSDEEIAQFCQVNFGVTFPLAKKSQVVKGATQNPVFHWLSQKDQNGWNDVEPTWNFSKYLIDESGRLEAYFEPNVSPNDIEL